MSHMDFHRIHTGTRCTSSGSAKILSNLPAILKLNFTRRRVGVRERYRTRRTHTPSAFHRRQRAGRPAPRTHRACLAASMIELHHHPAFRFDLMHEVDELLEPLFTLIGPEAQVVVGNAAVRRHSGRFDADEAGAGSGKVTIVHLVKKLHHAAARTVHSHRRHSDAVRQFYGADRNRRKEHCVHG